MRMTANDAHVHAVSNAEALPHLAGSLSRRAHGLISQPLVVGIAQQQERTRAHHRTQFVLVVGQTVDAFAAEVVALALKEPVIVGLVEILHTVHRVRDAPGCRSATAGFLGNGQGDALVEGSAIERHLARIGTSRHANAARVDASCLRSQLLQAVNQPRQPPGPFAVGAIGRELRIESVERMLAALVVRTPL